MLRPQSGALRIIFFTFDLSAKPLNFSFKSQSHCPWGEGADPSTPHWDRTATEGAWAWKSNGENKRMEIIRRRKEIDVEEEYRAIMAVIQLPSIKPAE